MLYSSVYNLFALIGRKAPLPLSLSFVSLLFDKISYNTYVLTLNLTKSTIFIDLSFVIDNFRMTSHGRRVGVLPVKFTMIIE